MSTLNLYCPDCGYRGSQRSGTGRCPACDSGKLRNAVVNEAPAQTTRWTRWRTLILLALWLTLIGLIVKRFLE